LYTTGDTRIWSSSVFSNGHHWDMDALAYGSTGGVDAMYAKGEPQGNARTMGSKRPALYRFDNYSTYYSCI